MKWKSILNKKRNETLILFSVLLMIAMVASMHNKHLSDLEESITTIYKDRLVAKDYIFDLSRKIDTKKVALSTAEDELIESITLTNHSIDQLLESYEKTRLTEEENMLLRKLKDDINLSVEFENQIFHNPTLTRRIVIKNHLNSQYDLILSDLEALSDIQLFEGKKILDSSNRIIASNGITKRLEVALLIVITLVFLMAISSP
ncbi:MAG: MCP four helix bundle domain-containing protein, partial [Ekhidna sp.]